MFELYLSHTSAGEHSTDPRNQFHETAFREARFASEWHTDTPVVAAATKPSFVSRLRSALAGGSVAAPESCACPA
jgi:hypothetical protein